MFKVGDIICDPMKNGRDNGYGITSGEGFKAKVIQIIKGEGEQQYITIEVLKTRKGLEHKYGHIYNVKSKQFALYGTEQKEEIIKLK